MAYSVQADLENAGGGAQRLLELTDDDGNGTIDAAVLAGAIAEADAWIDSYAQKRYSVPFSPVPSTIKLLSAREAVYLLKSRRPELVDEYDRERHEDRTRWLEGLAAGKVSPGTDPVPTASTEIVPQIVERDDDAERSPENLKGFW